MVLATIFSLLYSYIAIDNADVLLTAEIQILSLDEEKNS